jgi:dienelactone hydrolase
VTSYGRSSSAPSFWYSQKHMRAPRRRLVSSGTRTLCLLAGVAVVSASCTPAPKPATYVASQESWCPEGFEQGPDEACFALPEQRGDKTAVLIYLHHAYSGAGPSAEWNTVKKATEKGFAVVLVRGRRALCDLPGNPAGAEFCWPHDPDDTTTMKQMAKSWDKTIWQADALLEQGPHRHYVLGYGAGGSFAGTLATQGFLEASGYAVIGTGASMPTPAAGRKAPLVILMASDSDEGGAQAKSTSEALEKASWSHARCPHAQKTFSKEDLDVVLKTFSRERAGELASFPSSGVKATACDPPGAPVAAPKKK